MQIHMPPALRHHRFRLLWFGLMLSIAGTQMQVAGMLWHIRTLTDQPIALGGIGVARVLPIFVFSLIGGALADGVNRRQVLFITQTLMALGALALALLTFRGQINLLHIYLLTALQAMAVAFDTPARQALVPNLVPGRDLSNAFSLTSIAYETGAILGPTLAGFVIAGLGQGYTYLFNSLSYLAVLVALLLMGPIPQRVNPVRRKALSLAAIREGMTFIFRQPIILSSMLLDFMATFFSSATTLLPFIARDLLGLNEVAYGFLAAAQSTGALLAGLVLSQIDQLRAQGKILLGAVVVFGLATTGLGLAPSFLTAFAALGVIGASDSVSMVIRNTIRQLQTPDELRGRMTSVTQIFFMGGPQLGEIEAGLVAQFFGIAPAVVSGGIGCLVAVAWINQRWPQLRRYNGDEPILAGAG